MINREGNPDFINSFLDYSITILNKSPKSISEYNYDLNMFFKFMKMHFGLTKETDMKYISIKDFPTDILQKITLDDIHSFIYYMAINNNSKAATRARKISTIRVFFNYLSIKTDLITINPAQNLETPKKDKRLPKYLTLEESQKLLDITESEDGKFKERDFAIITLFLNCGMRLSELIGINVKDINFEEKTLRVIGKGNKERTIYLNKACIDALKNYLPTRATQGVKHDSKNSEKALFLSERRERISNRTVQYIVKKELQKAGLDTGKFSVHKLRHTAATLMYQYGKVDIRALQELLGHKSISTTEIYTHVNNDQIRNAVNNNPLNK